MPVTGALELPDTAAASPEDATEAVGRELLDDALAEFQGDLARLFARARALWKESAARVHPELQPAGYRLLAFIDRCGGTSAHELSAHFEMDKSVISRQVRMLEELRLLASRPDEHDGRLRVLTATPAAAAVLAELRRGHADRVRGAMAGLTVGELQTASTVFRRLAEA